jgi:hypothetical protein
MAGAVGLEPTPSSLALEARGFSHAEGARKRRSPLLAGSDLNSIREEDSLAGAVGLEPTPSSLALEGRGFRRAKGVRKRRSLLLAGSDLNSIREEDSLAGAVGLEPTPSSLTVRCPTNWTTPQPGFRLYPI